MNRLNYIDLAQLANTTPENFLKMPKRYEDSLLKKGFEFNKTGSGKNALYEIYTKTFSEMSYGEKFYFLFGEFATNDEVSEKYLRRMYQNYSFYKYLTDQEMCDYLLLQSKHKESIRRHRKQLSRLDLMVDIKLNKYDAKYYTIVDGRKNEIPYSYYSELMKEMIFYKHHFSKAVAIGDKKGEEEARKMLNNVVKHKPIKIHGRIMTRKFFVLAPYLLGEEEMKKDQQMAYEIYGYDETFFKNNA